MAFIPFPCPTPGWGQVWSRILEAGLWYHSPGAPSREIEDQFYRSSNHGTFWPSA